MEKYKDHYCKWYRNIGSNRFFLSFKLNMMKLTASFLVLFCLLYFKGNAQAPTYIQQQSLNGIWAFKTDPNGLGEKNRWYDEVTDSSGWDSMPVPGNWDLRNEYSHYVGKAWYRTTFSTPSSWQKQWVRLLFEAVYNDSKVWLNGHLLGSNNSGFLSFEFEVNKWLNFDELNTLAVCADNTFRRGAIWNWGGIRRPVILVATNHVRIVQQFISSDVDLQKNSAEIAVRIQLKNDESKPVSLQGEVVLTDAKGFQKTLPFNTTVEGGKTAEAIVHTTLNNKQVHLWNCDDPYLYQSKVSVKSGPNLLHEHSDRFGLRKIEPDNNNYTFKLNGVPLRVMGFNLVPDDRTTGNTLPLWRIKEDIDLMKSMGANMARLSHLPLPKEMLDYLDEKGIMIFSEIPLWGYDQLVDKNNPIPKEWLKRLVTAQYNHPAIIGWSVGNEIGHVPGAMEYVKSAIQFVKTLDTTHLAVVVSHTAASGISDPINYSDIGLINGYGSGIGMLADKIHGFHPDKLLFYAECGYGQLEEDLDGNVNAKAMIDSLRFKSYLMGGSLWTFNDYRSAYPGTKEYSENRAWGVVDVFRQKKKAWVSFKKEYAPVSELTVSNFINDKNASAILSIQPRLALDLPAYPLHHYSLAWKIYDVKGVLQKGGFINLPLINPGDKSMHFPIGWQMPPGAFKLQVSLLSPLNYDVADTVIFLQKPSVPKFIYAMGVRTQMNNLGNTGSIRVVFEKNATATYYKLRYGKNGPTNETGPTLNNYFNIPNLAFGDTYQVAIAGINSLGESESANTATVKIENDYPAPLITYTEPADKGFYVGYPGDQEDYLFQLQYTGRQGDYSTASTVQTTNKGVLFVPGLQNGQTYYYRMRRWKHNTYITPWSEEIAVTPDGGLVPEKPMLSGIIRQGTEAIVCFEPVKKATGYKLEYRGVNGNKWETQMVNAAQINHFKLNGLMLKRNYEFRFAALNQNGQSEYSQTVR